MGFFRWLFGTKAPRPPPPPPPTAFEPPSFPFTGEIRIRHEDYDRIKTGWWSVTVGAPEEWDGKIAEMEEGIRNNFGRFRTQDGGLVERWNDAAWAAVRSGLVVEKR
ncbi:MAG: hypothetical protein A3K65_07375 [Euryarchaeota archaeon RBG_16_68_12]|nr:MAG: hypothetical protein A3K65_07375 [Euryarchaeota archaeon RBG_16_68_12]